MLPKLETLILETCAMSSARLGSLLASRLPALETLEIWFGSPDRGDAHCAALVEAFPNVTVVAKDMKEFDSSNPNWRYCSVHE